MSLAASLPDIMPDEASEQIKPLYEAIQQQLRVPIVNLIFRSLANYPSYLTSLWQHFSPVICSNSFEQEADTLREKALLEQLPDTSDESWQQLEKPVALRDFNDTIFYVLPKLLLIASMFEEATFRGIRERRSRGEAAAPQADIPQGIAAGTAKAELLKPENAGKELEQLFASIRKAHAYPLVPSYYRGLANWPDFLQESWQRLQRLPHTQEYLQLKEFLTEQALNGVRRLPLTQPALPALEEEEKEEIKALLTAFRYKFIPEMLIEATLIKAMLDGPEEAYTSRFSAASSHEE